MKIIMNTDDKNHNIYDSGFDLHLNRTEVVEENERQFQRRIKEERDEKERRERLRIQRIAASGKDPLLYSLDEIIRKCVIHQGGEQIEIPLHDLGFQYSIAGAVEAHRFFNQLKDSGCFKDVERSANTYFIITKPDIGKLKEERSKLENKLGFHSPLKDQDKLLHKDKHGVYSYDKKKIEMDNNNLYYKVLDALYSHADQNGFLSYKDIEKQLITAGEEEMLDESKRNRRIINAISESQGLFRFAKINGHVWKNRLPDGDKLIDIKKGRGLQLNNRVA